MLVGQISGNIRVRLLSSTEIEHSIATLNRCPNFNQQTTIVFTSQYELVEISQSNSTLVRINQSKSNLVKASQN